MFGIIYTLLCLFGYGKGAVKRGIHDAKSSSAALNDGKLTYIDFLGRTREVVSNDQVMFEVEPLSQDWGYRIIEPKSKNHGVFVSISAIERAAMWEKYHQAWINGKPIIDDPDYPPITVVEWERHGSNYDNPHYKIRYQNGIQKNKPRKCRGRRYRDIETGRMFVEREYGGIQKVSYYMDAETGEPIRLSDRQIRLMIEAPWCITRERAEQLLSYAKTNYANAKSAGLQESDPDVFYQNYFLINRG